ncbi:hypothetical protein [Cuniculiplasma divulgatum]|uniref:hypothetical protein n=1 Tax=Cuniculiplasma divulgatum TaxID=1673428 RepID=UPI0011E5F690|nr:hypothetical protein [Cuniculiplasma divulgatum]
MVLIALSSLHLFMHLSIKVSCNEHGIIEAVMPCTEKSSRLTLRFETRSIGLIQYIETYNFTDIMKSLWKQAWNISGRALKRGMGIDRIQTH